MKDGGSIFMVILGMMGIFVAMCSTSVILCVGMVIASLLVIAGAVYHEVT